MIWAGFTYNVMGVVYIQRCALMEETALAKLALLVQPVVASTPAQVSLLWVKQPCLLNHRYLSRQSVQPQ